MADLRFQGKGSKQSDKVFTKGLAGSLALRVFSSTVIFLVLPLLIFSFVMYRYTFDLKKNAEITRLSLVSDNQTLVYEELVAVAVQRLEILSIYLQTAQKQDTKAAIDATLSNIQDFTGVAGICVLEKRADGIITTYSSEGFVPDIPLEQLMQKELFTISDFSIMTDQEIVGKKGYIYCSKLINSNQDPTFRIITIAISNKFFIEYLTKITGNEGVYNVSLFRNRDGVIFDTQEMSFLGKKIVQTQENLPGDTQEILFLKSISADDNSFVFEEGANKGYATVLPLSRVDFSILITASASGEYQNLEKFFYVTMVFLAGVIILGAFGSLGVSYLFSLPLKNISHVMLDISNHQVSSRYSPVFYGFEINKLGLMLNNMIDRLMINMQALEQQTIKREKLEKELEIGHRIQSSLVPHAFPSLPDISIKTALIPAKEVGGDFYDCFINPAFPDDLIILIADSAGHGVYGCFYSLIMRSILRTLGSTQQDLASILKQANQVFYKDSEDTQVFVTVWMGIFNRKTRELRFSSCGHPLGFLFRDQGLYQQLTTPGIALGAVENVEPQVDSIKILKGDLLVFLTDGVIETQNNQGEFFGKQRCIDTISSTLHEPLDHIFNHLLEQVEIFEQTPDNQEDDFTAMMIKID